MSPNFLPGPRGWGRLLFLSGFLPAMLTGCSPLAFINGAVPGDASKTVNGVAYGPLPRQRLDVYAPIDARDAPVVVFFYGGGWRSGERADYRFVGDALATHGIVTVVADYRLYPEVSYPGFLQDAAQATAWTFANIAQYGGNPGRLFVAGHSAGGYIAAMLALDPRWLDGAGVRNARLAGWVGMAGPYDFLPITGRDLRPVFNYPDTPADTQPIAHAGGAGVPALLVTGTADTTVDPVRNTGHLAQALEAAGACVKVIRYPDIGHKLLVGALSRPLRWRAPVLDDIVSFIENTQPCATRP
ncbi:MULTISPECIES: alpha/beta hydrolase [unclassified Achromobacter]|uniref:alpha/beta hydrolase n=1 Tax=unclassified Achromobacter TaxID=2626865 RepID=UPI000B51AA8D|nr:MULTISPECIES: alpha/beta hydrolase [unclassified Achromobacter]OWT74674.1 esterase [Achromobacter sp. HZ34]OWT79141.1 esterase [Achromobacter sp. HZ28]